MKMMIQTWKENEYLHIPNVQQTEDYDPALSDWST